VVDLNLNGAEAAGTTLAERWRQLAAIIEESTRLKEEAARDPARANDPWVIAHVRWINIFERELAAVQKVYEAVESGARLSEENVRAASDAAEKLLNIITEARTRSREPQPA
jgi:hypothetical protein